ncbi:hypothetical protein Golob_012101, partial [Gossypium lobatum]|nr:hypothetical protein [Gossypium lobatum]MBA0693193.1 hypothetical protein [Gossypium aridum]
MKNMIVSHWESPPTEWMKFNVAGVVLEEVAGYYRLWSLRKLLGDIDCGTKQLAHFQIAIIDRKSNGMADALAKA